MSTTTNEEITQEIECLELTKELSYTILHQLTFWQKLTRGRFWRKQYDEACGRLVFLSKATGE